MTIDFTEISNNNNESGTQDDFEIFARDFLDQYGYEIVKEPARGQDGGIDIKVKEVTSGEQGQIIETTWLVSCKHYAHSKNAVGISIEQDISDRVKSNHCDGFIGFYSTSITTSLQSKLEGMKDYIPHRIYDKGRMEREIVGFQEWERIFKRYFPKSYKKWSSLDRHYVPVKLFEFYLEKEKHNLSGLTIFLSVFKTPEFLLKALYGSQDYSRFITSQPLKYKVEHIKETLENLWSENIDTYNKVREVNALDAFNYIREKKFTEYISKKYKEVEFSRQKIWGIIGTDGYYYLYRDILIVSEALDNTLQILYKRLLEIIEKHN
jgi:hypothetical protein